MGQLIPKEANTRRTSSPEGRGRGGRERRGEEKLLWLFSAQVQCARYVYDHNNDTMQPQSRIKMNTAQSHPRESRWSSSQPCANVSASRLKRICQCRSVCTSAWVGTLRYHTAKTKKTLHGLFVIVGCWLLVVGCWLSSSRSSSVVVFVVVVVVVAVAGSASKV